MNIKSIKLSNRQVIAVLAGSFCLAIGLGSGLKLWLSSRQAAPSKAIAPAADLEASEPHSSTAASADQLFEQPFVRVGQGLLLANPTLLQSTPKEERVVAVTAGRSNPFAPITQPGAGTVRRTPQPSSSQQPPTSTPQAVQTVPVVATTQPLPPLPPVPSALPASNSAPLPTVAVAPNLPSLPSIANPASSSGSISPVDKVEISGVVQLAGRVRVIIREAGASTSRHVTVGDRLVGGQVRVKQVDLSGAEPLVVLEYNGQEFYRSVGSTALAGLP